MVPISWVRIGIVAFLGLVLWQAVALSAANAIEANRPELALRLSPFDATAASRQAMKVIEADQSASHVAEADRLAKRAFGFDAGIPATYRVLGLVAASRQHQEAAIRAIAHAEKLSRRDLPTQLFLIELAVSRDQVHEALRHYQIALQTHPDSKDMLFPVLIAAVGDGTLAPDLAAMIGRKEDWANELAFRIAGEATPLNNAIDVTLRAQKAGRPISDDIRRMLVDRLINAKDYRRAELMAGGAGAGGEMPRNADFSRDPRFVPFDWEIADTSGASGTVAGEGNGGGMAFLLSNGPAAALARQIVVAAPGTYSLETRFEQVQGEPPEIAWTLQCVGGETPLARLPLRGTQGKVATSVTIPGANCAAQWLTLTAEARENATEVTGVIRYVRLTPSTRKH